MRNKAKIDPCELVKELESFWIEEAVAQKLVIEFQPKNLEMLTQRDYQCSPTHYGFLYNALKNYIKNNCPDARSFLNALIVECENASDLSGVTFLSSLFGALLTGYVLDNLTGVMAFFCICLWGAIGIITTRYQYQNKPKLSFYLSILNQLKEDINPADKGSDDNNNVDKS